MTNFNERTNTLLYKDISLTPYSRKGWYWLCVRGELETGTDCYILTQSSSDHSITSSSSWLGLLNRGSLRAASPQSCKLILTLASCPPTDSNSNWNWPKPSVAPGYIILSRTSASAVPPLIYTGASLDWRLGRGSIYNIICCIHLLCDWSFRLFHHITYICYFVASYLFSLWYS